MLSLQVFIIFFIIRIFQLLVVVALKSILRGLLDFGILCTCIKRLQET